MLLKAFLIEDDFSYITPPEDASVPRSIFQQSLAINGMKRSKGAVRFASTAHPIFLIENLTSVLVLIESLLEKAKGLPFREQAMTTARRIWKQLTPYAQERLTGLLREAYPDDGEELRLFSRMLDGINAENNAFLTEKTRHESPAGYLLDALKLSIPCRVEYLKNGYELAEWTGTVRGNNINNGDLVIPEEDLEIPFEDLIMVTLLES